MIENDKFYMVSDEVREIFGELTEGEWKVWSAVVDVAVNEENKPIAPFNIARPICKEFTTFVDSSLNDGDGSFEYLVYKEKIMNDLFVYGQFYNFIDNAFEKCRDIDVDSEKDLKNVYAKLNSICDTLISKILSIKYNEIEAAGLEYSAENTFNGIDEWSAMQKQCVELVALNGMERMWHIYQKTDDYARRVAMALDARQEFLNVFQFNVKDDITDIDDKLTIVNNSEIYQAVLPEEVFECLEPQKETKKEKEL